MKNRKIFVSILICLLAISLSGCQFSKKNSLTGTWQRTKIDDNHTPHFGTYIQFCDDGILYSSSKDLTDENNITNAYWYEYEIVDDKRIEVAFAGNDYQKEEWLYSYDGNILTIKSAYVRDGNTYIKIQ